MANFDLDLCLKTVNNKYELVLLAKARAFEILSGSNPLVKKQLNEKPFFTALKEISSGSFTYDDLQNKIKANIKNEILGIEPGLIKKSVDKFNESSIFAKSFIDEEDASSKKEDDNDKYDQDSYMNNHLKMIGGFDDVINEENFEGFTNGLEIFGNSSLEDNLNSDDDE